MSMSADRWKRVEEIYHSAAALRSDARVAFVREACAGDEALRAEVESLLAQEPVASAFLEWPASHPPTETSEAAAMIGRQVGGHQISGLLGAGGMGAVYRARDTRLKRDVALKVLPAAFTRDADRLARLRREAEMLAALNHPNVASIYGLEDLDGTPVLVLEFVDGQTLAEQISRGPISVNDALHIASQIVHGLAAAHDQGVIHRDLKPANIALTKDGQVKILDFGVAKTMSPMPADDSQLPTLDTPTRHGMMLGTAAYMAPEQATGKRVGKRADIWAFGVVLYEMLTGRRAFAADTTTETLARVISNEPDWALLPAHTPVGIRRVLRRCLEKDPARRLADISDAGLELDDAIGHRDEAERDRPSPSTPRGTSLLLVATLAAACAAAVAGRFWFARAPVVAHVARFDVYPPEGGRFELGPPLSPDGRTLAFTVTSQGRRLIWVRPMESTIAKPLAGTEDVIGLFWSPDSRYIGFFAQGKLKKVAVAGGAPQVICESIGRHGAWSTDNQILIGGATVGGGTVLWRVPATGGQAIAETALDDSRKEDSHDYPEFLPDARHYLYLRRGAKFEDNRVVVGTLGGTDERVLTGIHAGTRYSPSGHLLFVSGQTLMAQPFDVRRRELVGDPVAVAERAALGESNSFSASDTGALAFNDGAAEEGAVLAWFNRSGQPTTTVPAERALYGFPSLSPDGRRVAINRTGATSFETDIWLIDLERGIPTRFTSSAGLNLYPVWSFDGRTIAYRSNRSGNWGLYRRRSDAAGGDELLFGSSEPKTATGFSPDGKLLLFDRDIGSTGSWDIWALPLVGDRRPFPVVSTPFLEAQATFSPDGRWLVYESDDDGGRQVYVQSFPPDGRRIRLSTTSGSGARWTSNGSEVVYSTLDNHYMAVRMNVSGRDLRPEAPRELFVRTPFLGNAQSYAVDASGQRFLIPVASLSTMPRPITVVLNWTASLPH